jgi:hypothetical protein
MIFDEGYFCSNIITKGPDLQQIVLVYQTAEAQPIDVKTHYLSQTWARALAHPMILRFDDNSCGKTPESVASQLGNVHR